MMAEEGKKNADQENEPVPQGPEPAAEDGESRAGKDLRQQLDEALKEAEHYKDLLQRKAAEFENYRRRSDADYQNSVRFANENLMLSLIPILSDFIRSLKAGREAKDFDAFFRGVELISAKLSRVLEQHGLVPFDSAGKPFDVHYHDALLQMPREDIPPDTVVEEVERGYMLHDRILKHAKVIVSSPPDGDEQSESMTNDDESRERTDEE